MYCTSAWVLVAGSCDHGDVFYSHKRRDFWADEWVSFFLRMGCSSCNTHMPSSLVRATHNILIHTCSLHVIYMNALKYNDGDLQVTSTRKLDAVQEH